MCWRPVRSDEFQIRTLPPAELVTSSRPSKEKLASVILLLWTVCSISFVPLTVSQRRAIFPSMAVNRLVPEG